MKVKDMIEALTEWRQRYESRSISRISEKSLRGLFIANGAAVVALLALMGDKPTVDVDFGKIATSLQWFSYGCIASLTGAFISGMIDTGLASHCDAMLMKLKKMPAEQDIKSADKAINALDLIHDIMPLFEGIQATRIKFGFCFLCVFGVLGMVLCVASVLFFWLGVDAAASSILANASS